VILRASKTDRRSQTVEMTKKGQEILKQMADESASFSLIYLTASVTKTVK